MERLGGEYIPIAERLDAQIALIVSNFGALSS
jgi:hypothetical protein